jgi:hypothetical protein
MSLHNFNPNNKSWKMYTNTITSINTDDILIKPYDGKNLLLEVSANNNILFKRGDISYGLDDLIGGGNSNIILTSVSGNIIPSTDNVYKLGDVSKNWSNAYIQNISATNISVTGTVGGITKAMVGLGNVDNTTDANKPVSTATQTALDLKANLANPTFTGTVSGITKAMVGLGNVDNTSDTAKPISTATQTALDLKANLANPTFTGTVGGITKAMVGLGNVDNTSDTAKPISTATQTALDLKANLANPTFTGTVTIQNISATNISVSGTVSGITKTMVGLGNVDNTSDTAKPISTATQIFINTSLSNVYTKIQVDTSFVSKQSFDTSYNTLLTTIGNSGNNGSSGSGGTSTTNYDTTLIIKNTIDLNEIHYDSNWYYKGQLINKTSCITGLGKTLALSDDGRTIVIGSNKNGLANVIPEIYVYYFIENTWVQKGTTIVGPVESYFGKKVAISGNGEVISVSDVKGNIYLYKWKYNINNTTSYNPILGAWVKLGATIMQEAGNGISMSLNYSGDKMACGSYLATTLQSDINNIYTNWKAYLIPITYSQGAYNVSTLCWNGSFFVGIGNVVTISYNGRNWTNAVPITGSYSSICWNGSIFCAVGGSIVATSIDGLIWTSRTIPNNSWQTVCWGNNVFVAVANNLVAVSSDGMNWSSKSLSVTGSWVSVCWGNNMFVACGGSAVMTSPDGSVWTYIAIPSSLDLKNICWNGSIFCAINGSGSFMSVISSDGVNWIAYQAFGQNQQPRTRGGLAWNGTVFCSQIGGGILYSYDGIFWVVLEDIISPALNNITTYIAVTKELCWNGSVFVGFYITGNDIPNAFVSPVNFPNHSPYKLYNFTETSSWNNNYNPLNNRLTCVCWGNNKFVAISSNGETNNRVIVSDDGINWSPATSGVENNNWISVCWGYDKFCAIANAGVTSNLIMISRNGMDWTPISRNERNWSWSTIVWGYDKFLVSAVPNSGGQFLVSPDGINWTPVRYDKDGATGLAWGNNRFIAVTNTGSPSRIYTSVAAGGRQAGANWHVAVALTTPALNSWTSVCWGNNIFIAVANSGTGNRIMRSSDGTTWTSVVSPADSGWSSVTFGNNRFVAVATTGTVKIMYSTDNTGTSWVALTSFISNNSFTSITFGNGKFCAVANSGLSNTRIITSSDGITWNSTNSQILTSNWNSICWNGSIFCAVANSDISNVVVKISTNGTLWTSAITGVLNNSWRSICWNGSIFCAVASSGNTNQRVMVSTNGLVWTNATSGVLNNSWSAICWNGAIFCALASSGTTNERAMISVNGLVWINATSGVLNNNWSALCWNGTIFCAIANSGETNTLVMTSANGLTWNNSSSNVPDNSWNSICWNGYIFCAVASSGTNRVMISTNGINWTSYNMNLPDTYWSSICWNGNFFCAVANGGLGNRVATSYDGIVWTSRTSIYENNNWNSICWNGSIFCAIASSGVSRAMTSSINYGKEYSYKLTKNWNPTMGTLNNNFTGAAFNNLYGVYTTSDGSSNSQWIYTTAGNLTSITAYSVAVAQKSWRGICIANDNLRDSSFCLVADNATGNDCVLTFASSNAVNNPAGWLNAISGVVNSTWNSICWNGSIFCAVARSGATTNQQVMTSSNGRVWQNATSGVPDSSWVSVCWGNTMFCAVANSGTQRVMTSLDGLTWTGRVSNPSDSNWTSITWGNNLFCAVANSGTLRVMISYDGITWTGIASDPPSNNWTSVTWGNNIFCAVANNSTSSVMTSRDGIIWTNENYINNPWNCVAWDKFRNLFIVLSSKTQSYGSRFMISSPSYGKFLYTEKSIWYTQSLTVNTSVSNLSSITWADDRFCAVGTSFAITSIDNGNTWTRYSLGSGITFNEIAYANGILLARAGSSFIRSLDKGVSWSSVYTPSVTIGGDLISANNIFFIASNDIIYSTNGIDFSYCIKPLDADTIGHQIKNIVWNPIFKIYVGVQTIFSRYFSSFSYNGIEWYFSEESYHRAYHVTAPAGAGSINIAWSPKQNVYVIRGQRGDTTTHRFYTSYNGTKWQEVADSKYQEVNYDTIGGDNMLWDGNNFISYTQYKIWSSSDGNGNNWILREDISKSNFFSNVITIYKLASDGNGKICGVGFNSVLNQNVIIRFSDNYGYDFPGVAFKNGIVRIYDINNFGNREIGYFETANESEKNSLSVEMSSDGKTVVAGFPSSDSSGNSVKIYTYENNTWKSLTNQIKDLSLNSNYNFGTCVATSANGSIIAVAAMSSNNITNGYVKVYKAQNTYPKTYVQLGNTIETNFGTPITFYNSSGFDVSYKNNLLNDISFQNKCLALSANGYVLTIGNMNDFNTKGSVRTYIYNATNNSWNVIKDISGVNIGDRYGLEVHMPKYDYNTLAWSADPSGISTSLINYGSSGTITY